MTPSGIAAEVNGHQRARKVMGPQLSTETILGNFSAAMSTLACAVGDRVGLFKVLATGGPATSTELATRTGTDERCVRQWLSTLASGGYLEYEPEGERFALPTKHTALLVDDGGMLSLVGGFQLLLAFAGAADQIAESFFTGRGVPQLAYEPDLQRGMERMSAPWFEHLLVQHWLPSVPELLSRLQAGIRVADVGCGSGRSLITLAKTFPASEFTGYDVFGPALSRARKNAEHAGVSTRIRFVQLDVTHGIPDTYDLVTTFNSLHDIADQVAGLEAIRRTLTPDGSYLILESSCSDKLEENFGPLGTILYATSLFYSTPTSIANGGDGSGAILSEDMIHRLCTASGFYVRRLSVTNPMHALYEAKVMENVHR
jgi:SAM-dependent methyltransferase/predicted transcriptional regulator